MYAPEFLPLSKTVGGAHRVHCDLLVLAAGRGDGERVQCGAGCEEVGKRAVKAALLASGGGGKSFGHV